MMEFVKWLCDCKCMSERAAKDVCSRLKRVHKLLGTHNLDRISIDQLCNNVEFLQLSMFVKSQLKRAVALEVEYKETYKKQ